MASIFLFMCAANFFIRSIFAPEIGDKMRYFVVGAVLYGVGNAFLPT